MNNLFLITPIIEVAARSESRWSYRSVEPGESFRIADEGCDWRRSSWTGTADANGRQRGREYAL